MNYKNLQLILIVNSANMEMHYKIGTYFQHEHCKFRSHLNMLPEYLEDKNLFRLLLNSKTWAN